MILERLLLLMCLVVCACFVNWLPLLNLQIEEKGAKEQSQYEHDIKTIKKTLVDWTTQCQGPSKRSPPAKVSILDTEEVVASMYRW